MNQNPSPPSRVSKHFLADPWLWALWLLVRRTASVLKSAYLGWLFGAPRLYLGPSCRISGSRFIHFGSNLHAQGNLWLHAISAYNQQRFEPRIAIGNHVSFSERVHITCIEKIEIGDRVLVGSGVFIGDHHHGSYRGSQQSHPDTGPIYRPLGGGGPVSIGDDVWIGDNAVILGPVSIGRGSIIGANSVVCRDIPERTIAAGAPARPVKRFSEATSQWERIHEDALAEAPAFPARTFRGSRA